MIHETMTQTIFRECNYNHHEKCLNKSARCECDCHSDNKEYGKIKNFAKFNDILRRENKRLKVVVKEQEKLLGLLKRFWRF